MSDRSRLRPYRIALLVAIGMMHVFAVRELFWQPFLTRLMEKPQSRSISWITLPPPVLEQPKPAEDFSVAPLLLPNNRFELIIPPAAPVLPPETPSSSPPAIAVPLQPADSAVLGTLGQSLACNLANYEKLSPEEKERCLKRLAKLKDEPASAYVATDGEKRLAQQFARELAIKQAPPLLPCFSSVGLGVSVYPCLIRGVLNGFDFSNAPSYADAQTTDK
jgi:hypothetical protein